MPSRVREGTKQFNATVDEGVLTEFNKFCEDHGFVRDRKVQLALALVLDLECRKPVKKVVVDLNEEIAAMLHNLREELFLREAVGAAINGLARIGPKRSERHATRGRKKAGEK